MIQFSLYDVARAVSGKLHEQSESNKKIVSVFTDSREACDGGLFCAIRGEKRDGHDFVKTVAGSGGCSLVDREDAFIKNTVLVGDVKKALYDLADWYRREKCPSVKAICITGSVGKTTTKDMTGLVFSANAKTFVTGGNRNSLIGLPLSVLSIEKDDEYAVLELGMSERGEIEKLSKLARPYLSLITTIGSSHLEALGSIENIKNEKFDILKGEVENGMIILNADNTLEREEGMKLGKRAVFCSVKNGDVDFAAHGERETDDGTVFTITHGGSDTPVVIHVPGLHNVSDALLAFAAGVTCGFEPKKCALALNDYIAAGNRQHRYVKNGVTVIADCYNASPESMEAALDVLAESKGRRIAVLGDMLELGAESKKMHMNVAKKAAASADILIFVGDMSEIYAEASGTDSYRYGIGEKSAVAAKLKEILKQGDTVLFKASNRIHLEDIIKEADL